MLPIIYTHMDAWIFYQRWVIIFFDIYRKFEDDIFSGLVIDTSVFACDDGTNVCDLFGKSKYNGARERYKIRQQHER